MWLVMEFIGRMALYVKPLLLVEGLPLAINDVISAKHKGKANPPQRCAFYCMVRSTLHSVPRTLDSCREILLISSNIPWL
jgi:hypothetical protein